MIKMLTLEKAMDVWDKKMILMDTYSPYQFYNWSKVHHVQPNKTCFCYSIDESNRIIIMALIDEYEEKISIPFGPATLNIVTEEQIIVFIKELYQLFNKTVEFSILDDEINKTNFHNSWLFCTPLVDTSNDLQSFLSKCNENRRRIIKSTLINIKDSQIIRDNNYYKEFYELYKKRLKEVNGEIGFSLDYLEKLLSISNNNLIVCVDSKKVISGIVYFKYGNTIITRYNCFDSAYKKISPTARLDYELIKEAIEDDNIKYYDISGIAVASNATTKNLSVNRYKNSYGPCKVLRYNWYKYNGDK